MERRLDALICLDDAVIKESMVAEQMLRGMSPEDREAFQKRRLELYLKLNLPRQ